MFKKYEIIEDTATADIAFRAYGENLEEAFSNSGLCLFNIMTDIDNVETNIEKEIEVESEDKESLMFDYLSEFLYIFDVDRLLFSEINVDIEAMNEGYRLKAKCKGEKFDPERHPFESEVKAISYFDMKIEENEYGWICQVVLDL
ncbi:MAG: archease [Candidatus Aenigmatarchaeota archaeon]